MSKPSKFSFYVIVAILSLAAGVAYKSREMGITTQMSSTDRKAGADKFFSATLSDLNGAPQAMSKWRGKIVIVNFWATWCLPCRDEIPELIDTYTTYQQKDVVILGVAIDDAEKVASFHKEFNINYPVLVGEFDAFTLAEAMGNPQGALPFTVTIDRSGMIVDTHLGRIKKKQIEEIINPMLQ
ncbi:TlpA disulfide reductase family protein [Nitrosomonas sp.]|uniref:TlpA family protein disulfide reductase n=1 Tax=Nitrosomonas sp. TaxID=42353 RepID=UPI0025FCE64B|nr:TlpA disulfide reductase family protein [Nitrosomonas sp.]MCC6916105.1 TlpA family protein disulfide reductase [Nitrosomonas sp.]